MILQPSLPYTTLLSLCFYFSFKSALLSSCLVFLVCFPNALQTEERKPLKLRTVQLENTKSEMKLPKRSTWCPQEAAAVTKEMNENADDKNRN